MAGFNVEYLVRAAHLFGATRTNSVQMRLLCAILTSLVMLSGA